MTAHIFWRVHIRASNDAARERVLARVIDALGTTVERTPFDPYWKDERDYVATLTTPLENADAAAGVLETFAVASRLRPGGWYTTGPQIEAGDAWSFELTAGADNNGGGFSVPGIVFVSLCATRA